MTVPDPVPSGPGAELAKAKNTQGIRLAQEGKLPESTIAFREALQIYPNFFDALSNLGNVLTFQRQHSEARSCYERAMSLRPGDANILNNLSNLLREMGDLEGSIAKAREAIVLMPYHAGAFNNLGAALLQLGKLDEAATSFERAITLRPDMIDVYLNLADTLWRLGRYADAAARAREVIRQQPGNAVAYGHLGISLVELGQTKESEAALREAIRLSPGSPKVHANLAYTLWKMGRLPEAETHARKGLELQPHAPEAYETLGVIMAKQGKYAESRELYEKALQIRPDFLKCRVHRSLILLVTGEVVEGWIEYEHRLKVSIGPGPAYPLWDGGSLEGRTILLVAEQGLGDSLHFVRYAPMLKERGARVILTSSEPLIPLLRNSPGLDDVVSIVGEAAGVDVYVRLMSLPHRMGTTLETIPAPIPYIFPDESVIERWRGILAEVPGLKVGILWRGNPAHPDDWMRSLKLADFEPLSRVPNVSLLSLQLGGSEDIKAVSSEFKVENLAERMDQTPGALMDAAGAIKNLDLLITCDTSLAHVAGGMGVPVWLLLAYVPDWRWMVEREDTPWYPAMRLFRQTKQGDWAGVMSRVAEALRKRAGA